MKIKQNLASFASLLILSACGGGSDSGSNPQQAQSDSAQPVVEQQVETQVGQNEQEKDQSPVDITTDFSGDSRGEITNIDTLNKTVSVSGVRYLYDENEIFINGVKGSDTELYPGQMVVMSTSQENGENIANSVIYTTELMGRISSTSRVLDNSVKIVNIMGQRVEVDPSNLSGGELSPVDQVDGIRSQAFYEFSGYFRSDRTFVATWLRELDGAPAEFIVSGRVENLDSDNRVFNLRDLSISYDDDDLLDQINEGDRVRVTSMDSSLATPFAEIDQIEVDSVSLFHSLEFPDIPDVEIGLRGVLTEIDETAMTLHVDDIEVHITPFTQFWNKKFDRLELDDILTIEASTDPQGNLVASLVQVSSQRDVGFLVVPGSMSSLDNGVYEIEIWPGETVTARFTDYTTALPLSALEEINTSKDLTIYGHQPNADNSSEFLVSQISAGFGQVGYSFFFAPVDGINVNAQTISVLGTEFHYGSSTTFRDGREGPGNLPQTPIIENLDETTFVEMIQNGLATGEPWLVSIFNAQGSGSYDPNVPADQIILQSQVLR